MQAVRVVRPVNARSPIPRSGVVSHGVVHRPPEEFPKSGILLPQDLDPYGLLDGLGLPPAKTPADCVPPVHLVQLLNMAK